MRFPSRVLRAREIVSGQLNMGIINDLLENLAFGLEDRNSEWLGLSYRVIDRRLEQFHVEWARDSYKCAQLPLGTEPARFLRKPDMQLGARQRKCPVVQFPPSAPKHTVHLSARVGANLSCKLLGRLLVQVCP
ncbi:hypothetical protein A5765_05200 [Mycolicibacterium celeriflavum]|nr:hypothetical protein A5765_05200 [Mycolicibacterium celeriflavum]